MYHQICSLSSYIRVALQMPVMHICTLLTCTKRGIQLRPRMTALFCTSLASIWRAPTVPSTISSILTPSTMLPLLPFEAADDRCRWVSWCALISNCTILQCDARQMYARQMYTRQMYKQEFLSRKKEHSTYFSVSMSMVTFLYETWGFVAEITTVMRYFTKTYL